MKYARKERGHEGEKFYSRSDQRKEPNYNAMIAATKSLNTTGGNKFI